MSERRTRLLVAMRSDLLRVAREDGMPDGFAPSIHVYNERGRGCFSATRIMAVWEGYDPAKSYRPRVTWAQAMRRFGLRTARDLWTHEEEEVFRDLYRVAIVVERPHEMPTANEYRRHGRKDDRALRRRFGSWNRLAELAGLEPRPRGGAGKAQMRESA